MHEAPRSRAGRTRGAIIDAFDRLVLERRKRRIEAADVVAEAGIGRSTFYDHFSSADQLRLEAFARPLATLADAAAGKGDPEALERLLDHFWEYRAGARDFLSGRAGDQAQHLLAGLVEQRLDGELLLAPRLAARQLADAALSPVRAWLLGEASATTAVLAGSLCASGTALASALRRR